MSRCFSYLALALLFLGCAPAVEPMDPRLHTATIEVLGMT
jgi:hypothetical protein